MADVEIDQFHARILSKLNELEKARCAEKKAGASRAWEVAVRLMVPLMLVTGATIINLLIRVSSIEANRFTSGDWVKKEQEFRTWVENHYPPQWMREQLQEIYKQVGLLPKIEARLETLDDRVKRLEEKAN